MNQSMEIRMTPIGLIPNGETLVWGWDVVQL